jgi:serine/threonine protein kinase
MPMPEKLGHFNLLEEIGHGGMSTVYRAFDPTLNREVAIKLLREDLARDPKFKADFLREARTAAGISHPHIVQVHFVGEENGQQYIVMELLKGRTLREIIEKDGTQDEERALDIAIEVAEGLRTAYKSEMIHGDIKPANIFVTDDVGAKILDFGLAKLANVEVSTQDGVWGSPYYISPERVGRKAEDFRSDVYSLGATLFHVLTGRPPFDADTLDELALKRLNEKPPFLRDLNPKITQRTEQVVSKMLNKSIFLRYRDYDMLLDELREAKMEATAKRLGVQLQPQPQPVLPEIAPAPPKKSPVPLVATVTAVGLIVVISLSIAFWPRQPNTAVTPSAPSAPPPAAQPAKPVPAAAPPAKKIWNLTFSLLAPNAKEVFVVGEFNKWNATATPLHKDGRGNWTVTVPLEAGRHVYKFVVDGRWIPDPDNPETADDGYGGKNSVAVAGN